MNNPTYKRSDSEKEQDYTLIAQLYGKSQTLRQIQHILHRKRPYSLSLTTIKRNVDKVLERWKEKQAEHIDNFITMQLEQYRLIKEEAWAEYERSKKPAKYFKEKRKAVMLMPKRKKSEELSDEEIDELLENTKEITSDTVKLSTLDDFEPALTDLSNAPGLEIDQEIGIKEQLGNPRYLEVIAKVMEQEAKLLGFSAGDAVSPSSNVVVIKLPESNMETTINLPPRGGDNYDDVDELNEELDEYEEQ